MIQSIFKMKIIGTYAYF